MKRGQFAAEYLLVAGFILLFFTIGFYFLYTSLQTPIKGYEIAQIQKSGTVLVHTAAEVFYVPDSKVTVEVIFPKDILNITTTPDKKELVVTLRAGKGYSDIAIPSNVKIKSHFNIFTPGVKKVSVESRGNYVLLCNIEPNCNCNSICEPGETPENCAPDCCLFNCTGCQIIVPPPYPTYTYPTYKGCSSDGTNHTACKGHNGCPE